MQFEFGFPEERRPSGILAKKSGIARARHVAPNSVLPGLQYRPLVTLFFALQLQGKAAAEAFGIACEMGRDLPENSIVPLKNLHVTFHLVAQQEGIPESLRQKARNAVSAVSALSFDVTFDRLENFVLDPQRHALVLLCGHGLNPLAALHSRIEEALRQAGFKHIEKSFVPHVTLVYNTKRFATPPIAPVSWRVNRFALIESIYGTRKHLPQGSWILQ